MISASAYTALLFLSMTIVTITGYNLDDQRQSLYTSFISVYCQVMITGNSLSDEHWPHLDEQRHCLYIDNIYVYD
jgi:hypothetical protein